MFEWEHIRDVRGGGINISKAIPNNCKYLKRICGYIKRHAILSKTHDLSQNLKKTKSLSNQRLIEFLIWVKVVHFDAKIKSRAIVVLGLLNGPPVRHVALHFNREHY